MDSFWFPSIGQVKVQGFIIKPPNFDPNKKYPVKFLIHGGPQGAWGDSWSYRWNAELLAANGYVVIMINPRGSTGYGQAFVDGVNGDWGGKPYIDLMRGLDYAERSFPYIDKTRECALGASYGGYMANWILGHTDRFKCIVTHDGMFNPISAYGTTEELWFNEWEFKGKPWDYYGKRRTRPIPQMVAGARREELQDANSRRPRPARLPPRRLRRLPALHHAPAAERPVKDALLPRRRPLGAQTTKLPALVQDRQRLGRPVHEANSHELQQATQETRTARRSRALRVRHRARSARRMSTVVELKRLMRNRVEEGETGNAKILAVVHRLEEQHYLDDPAYAASFTRLRQENEKFGKRRVQQELSRKGVNSGLISTTLDAAYENVSEEALARKHLERKRIKPPTNEKESARVVRLLVRGGFSTGVIFKILKSWNVRRRDSRRSLKQSTPETE